MRLVITPEESARLDAASPVPVDVLMDRAGYGVALAAHRMGARYGSRITVLAGTGNNGGDGYVAAAYLARRGVFVRVLALGGPKSEAAATAARRARAAAVPILPIDGMVPDEVGGLVIDAVFGVGFRGSLPDALVPWARSGVPTLAVDVPSGLDAASGEVGDVAFSADATVTFQALKTGHLLAAGPARCGPIVVVDIGLVGARPEFLVCEDEDAPAPARDRHDHKWSAGSVAVLGGTPGLTGAAMLTATAALHAGAGSVAVIAPPETAQVYAALSAEVMTRILGRGDRFRKDDAAGILEVAERFDVLVVGPGVGDESHALVRRLVEGRAGRLLLDADGITALDGPDILRSRDDATVLTPHAGEFHALSGATASYAAAEELARSTGTVVVLKGAPTFVAGTGLWAVTSNGPELATIGTGDVLAGMIAAMWARGLDAETAARSAAHRHGLAGGDLAQRTTVTAGTLARHVGRFAW